MTEPALLTMLSAGGDLATIALVAIMWRFDRRLLALELQLKLQPKGAHHGA